MFLPVNLRAEGLLCVIIGAGNVAARKCQSVLRHGVRVRVAGAEVHPNPIWQDDRVEVLESPYESRLLEDAGLVIAATDDAETNAHVARDARVLGIPALRVDCPADSDFILPATLRQGNITMAFGTDGQNPALAARMRREAEEKYGQAFAATAASGCREAIESPNGFVSLVGAGPGDSGLITVKGAARLRQATAIVHDALANPELLELCSEEAERIDMGKRKGCSQHLQPEINQLLVDLARKGHRVVRLKGGDPTIFGRGGEEARALAGAGIPFELIPGVSSVSAVPAYAGIPVTDREYGASSFGVYSLHLKNGSRLKPEQWCRIANGPDTLVFLMGLSAVEEIATNLMRCGREARTPVAIVLQGTTAAQHSIVGTLGSICAQSAAETMTGPGLVIVGEVVGSAERMSWVPLEEIR